jgi:hypothetical protein
VPVLLEKLGLSKVKILQAERHSVGEGGNRCGGVRVEAGRESLTSSAGAALLLQTRTPADWRRGVGGLSPWRSGRSLHEPGKTVLDLAGAIPLGGDCLADAAVVSTSLNLRADVAISLS